MLESKELTEGRMGKNRVAGETEATGPEPALVLLWMVYLNSVLVRKG